MSMYVLNSLVVFLISLLTTKRLISFSIKKNLLDIPNERSAHVTPKPRLGGLAILLSFYIGFSFLVIQSKFTDFSSIVLVVVGLLGAFLGIIDDIHSLSARIRLLLQIILAVGVVMMFFHYQPAYALFLFGLFLVFWIVGCINSYNFMDGIDGIAGVQGLAVAFCWVLCAFKWNEPIIASLAWILIPSILGFLVFNWYPSKIFMGDGGSYFLGYIFSVYPIICSLLTKMPFPRLMIVAILSLFPFIADSLFTFTKRLIQGHNPFKAHRDHFYQRLDKKNVNIKIICVLYGVVSIILVYCYLQFECRFLNLSFFSQGF